MDCTHGTQLVYRLQPIIRLADSSVFGEEVLAGRECCPALDIKGWFAWYERFFPEVGRLVRRGSKRLFINVSTEQLMHDGIFEMLQLIPYATYITLEWTEYRLAVDGDDVFALVLERLAFLRRIGFQVAVDDVGSGEDGLGRALAIRPEVAKIDGKLFRALRSRRGGGAFLRGIVSAFSAIGTIVVVEHIESADDLIYAKSAGAHCGQGRFFEAI